MPEPPHGTGMSMAYERWAQTWGRGLHVSIAPVQPAAGESRLASQQGQEDYWASNPLPTVSAVEKQRAEAAKTRGNAEFKAGRLLDSLVEYNAAKAKDPTLMEVYLNIAAVHLKLARVPGVNPEAKAVAHQSAMQACNIALHLRPSHLYGVTIGLYLVTPYLYGATLSNTALHLSSGKSVKAWFRRSRAFVGMVRKASIELHSAPIDRPFGRLSQEDHVNGYYDLKKAAVLAPDDAMIRKFLAEAYHPMAEDANQMTGLVQTAKEEYFYANHKRLEGPFEAWKVLEPSLLPYTPSL